MKSTPKIFSAQSSVSRDLVELGVVKHHGYYALPRSANGAAAGGLRLSEISALFWHCADGRPEGLTRERIGAAVVERGLAGVTPVLKVLLGQILQGRGPV